MKQTELLDSFCVSGTDKDEFKKIVLDLANSTKARVLTPENIKVYCRVNDINGDELIINLVSNPVRDVGGDYYYVDDITKTLFTNYDRYLMNEVLDNGLFFGELNESGIPKTLIGAAAGIQSDLAVLGISGSCIEKNTYHLAGLILQQFEKIGKMTFVTRESDDGISKVIGIRSKQYMLIPQNEAIDLMESIFPDGELKKWHVNNQFTEAFYHFPAWKTTKNIGGKHREIIPYIRFVTSDSGESSLTASLGWEIDGTYMSSPIAEASRRHKGTWNASTITEISSNIGDLRSKFTELSDKLDELEQIKFYDYGEGAEVASNFMDDNKRFKLLVNKDIRAAIAEEAKIRFSDPGHSAAEIVLFLMESPNFLTNLNSVTTQLLRKAIGEFPYIKPRGFVGINI